MPFVSPRSTPFVPPRTRGELPHLLEPGGTYFVTFRLWDSVIPAPGRSPKLSVGGAAAADLLRDIDPPLALGSCLLGDDRAAKIVANALRYFDGQRYTLGAWCVMPNHVHAIIAPWVGYLLDKVLHSWKSFTAHEINRALGRTGVVWERESFDHLVRDSGALDEFAGYVEQNPVAAGLVREASDWPHGSAAAARAT